MDIIGKIPKKEYCTVEDLDIGDCFFFLGEDNLFLKVSDYAMYDLKDDYLGDFCKEDYFRPVNTIKVQLTIME